MSEHRVIWLFAVSEYRWLWVPFARELARKNAARTVLFVNTSSDKRWYETQIKDEDPVSIDVIPDAYSQIIDGADVSNPDAVAQAARAAENHYGVGFVRDFIQADRHVGRAFMPGGQGYPVSHTHLATTWPKALKTVLDALAWWQQRFDEDRPMFLVCYVGGIGLAGKPPVAICRHAGVPIRNLMPARFGARFFWAEDEYGNSAEFDSFYRASPPGRKEDLTNLQAHFAPTLSSRVKAPVLIQKMAWGRSLQSATKALLRGVYWKLRGVRKARVGATLSAKVLNHFGTARRWSELKRLSTTRLADLQDRHFVFMPLQVEPEITIHGFAPDTTDQMHFIIKAAANLPADHLLAVKEHIFAVSGRSNGFYRQLSKIPNLVLVDPLEPSLGLINAAQAVCTINSSAGNEAAVLGKRVFMLSQHASIHGLDHVHHIAGEQDWATLRHLSPPTAHEEQHFQTEGARFFRAMLDYCIDVTPLQWLGRKTTATPEEASWLADTLMQTLPTSAKHTEAAL